MSIRKLISVLPALTLLVCSAAAQNQPKTTIEHVPAKPTSSASGQEMYTSYCAVCHGTEGKGAGPAASALKTAPADLTRLSANNGGKYPALKVSSAIRGTNDLPAHGSKDMPVWGQVFWGLSNGHEGEVQQRVANLTQYLETLQTK
jgi:mono/diheme cytochrome c family protein